MTTEEHYQRKYYYEGGLKTGLKFRADHRDGFTPVAGRLSQLTLSAIINRMSVDCGNLTNRASDYLLAEICQILAGKDSIWRIDTICPIPNCIRLELQIKDSTMISPADAHYRLIQDLLESGNGVIVDIEGEDKHEPRPGFGQQSLIRLQSIDEVLEEICFIESHAYHNTKRSRSPWKSEQIYVCMERQSLGSLRIFRRKFALSWKDASCQSIVAEIEEEN